MTADEIPDPQALHLICRVNGEVVQDATTDLMVFGVAELISFCSHSFTLEPGDVLLTGTPWGCGEFMDPRRSLAPGDVVECEIDGHRHAAQPGRRGLEKRMPITVEVPESVDGRRRRARRRRGRARRRHAGDAARSTPRRTTSTTLVSLRRAGLAGIEVDGDAARRSAPRRRCAPSAPTSGSRSCDR